jgi:hypothetical protein
LIRLQTIADDIRRRDLIECHVRAVADRELASVDS